MTTNPATPLAFLALPDPSTQAPVDETRDFIDGLLAAWAITCEPVFGALQERELSRLAAALAEVLRLASEGVSVQELRLIAAARGGWERPA